MSKNNGLSIDGLLDEALKETVIIKTAVLQIGKTEVEVSLQSIDLLEISKRQQIIWQKNFRENCAEGLDKYSIDEAQWQETLSLASEAAREQLEKDKPENLAAQMASKFSMLETILELVPARLKTQGKLLLPKREQVLKFKELVNNDAVLFRQILDLYVAVSSKEKEVSDAAKNEEAGSN